MQTRAVHIGVHYDLIEKEYEKEIIVIMSKYPNIEYKIEKDVKKYKNIIRILKGKRNLNKYILLIYLEQYYVDECDKKELYLNLSSDLCGFYVTKLISSGNEREEKEYGNFLQSKRYAYFIVDKKNEKETKEIVKFLTGIDIEIKDLEVKNSEYDIDGLIVFKIDEGIKENCNSSISYRILCMLIKAGINNCHYSDRDGKIKKELDIRMKKREDNRNSKLGFRADLGCILRSSWEADFARVLNYLNIDWEYEKEGFSLESKYIDAYYLPDFFLNGNTIIEIKGFWDEKSRKKVKCFKENYKDYKLLLIDGDMMRGLFKTYSHKIHEWESYDLFIRSEKIPVVGITILERKKYVDNIEIGEEVYLERDLDNKYDANAIKVLNANGNLLGYISAEWAVIYSTKLDLGMKYEAKVVDKKEKVLTIELKRVNIEDDIFYNFLKEDELKVK